MENQIVKLYKEGKSTRKITTETGVSQTQVCRILAKYGVKSRSNKINSELEKEILNKYNSGESSEKIAKDYNLNGSTICRIVQRLGGTIRSSKENKRKFPIIDVDWLEEINSEAKAYFLGFMYADDCVCSNRNRIFICLHKQDINILKTFESFFFNVTPGETFTFSGEGKYVNFGITNAKIKKHLVKHGCVSKKTFKITFPEFICN